MDTEFNASAEAECNYDVGHRELLAVKMEELIHWPESIKHPFLVQMDHKNLFYIKGAKRQTEPQRGLVGFVFQPICVYPVDRFYKVSRFIGLPKLPSAWLKEILNSHRVRGQVQYLVDCEGYVLEQHSWVLAAQILDPDLIRAFRRDRTASLGRLLAEGVL
ncbi:hypothetical protein NFI96_002223 [Prochilodus magdalenae]|nr:hypothetical protein NFI96_002223 [Prochilodus magdalenae]